MARSSQGRVSRSGSSQGRVSRSARRKPRVGKRARTHQALLDAALALLAEQGETFSLTEVSARAGVSHGTFYNYFVDRDALMDALVTYAVEDFAVRSAHEVKIDDEAVRFATISARALRTAVSSPNVVRFALQLGSVQRALVVDGPLSNLRKNLTDGHRQGRFATPPDDGVLDVILGSLLLAARRIIDGDSDTGHQASVIRRLLMSLGVEAEEARRIAATAVAAAAR